MRFTLLIFVLACSSSQLPQVEMEPAKKSAYLAKSQKYVISSQGAHTTMAAKYAFDKGGNIFDAFVAASFAISVERPHSSGLGGGGFLVAHTAKEQETFSYDFRERAPLKADPRMYLNSKGEEILDKSREGVFAVGVPGLVAGIWEIHKKYGQLPFEVLLKPAIELAQNGMPVYPALALAIKVKASSLCKYPASKAIFLKSNCDPRLEGETLYQKDLASTLRLIAKEGKSGFYRGKVASAIVKQQKSLGGLITHQDLRNYEVKKRDTVEGSFKGKRIVSMAPPSSGGVHVIEILNILSQFKLKSSDDPQSIHLTASAMQAAFADRAKYMGDSDFVSVPVKTLTSMDYAKRVAKTFNKTQAQDPNKYPIPLTAGPKESDHTTHFTIMDMQGNVVSSTQTINGWFGSSVVATGTGVVLNNEMDDFATRVGGVNMFQAIGGKNNLVAPKKTPLSSMSPTIVFNEDGSPLMALGTPSGTRILTCVAQTILNVLEYKMDLWSAVASTRYHHQWYPDELKVGPPYFSAVTHKKLEKMGYKIDKNSLGCKVQAVMRNENKLIGVSDPREEGRSYGAPGKI